MFGIVIPKDLTFHEISILLDFNLSYKSNIKKTQKQFII